MNKTHWKKIVSDPNFIGEADFQEGEEKILTIERVNQSETVATAEGKSKKAVVYWREKGHKPMILNVARSKSIEKVAGSGYFEDWPGVQVQLYIEHGIKAFGEMVSAVRVRSYKPRPKQAVPPCADCGSVIEPAMGRDARYLAVYTEKNYGAPLCAACAQKRREEAAASGEQGQIASTKNEAHVQDDRGSEHSATAPDAEEVL